MWYVLLNDKTSRRRIVSCDTPCRIQLVEPCVTGIRSEELYVDIEWTRIGPNPLNSKNKANDPDFTNDEFFSNYPIFLYIALGYF